MPTLDPSNKVAQSLSLFEDRHEKEFGEKPTSKVNPKKEEGKHFYHFVLKTKYSILSFEGKDHLEYLAIEKALIKAEMKAKKYFKTKEKTEGRERRIRFVKKLFLRAS